MTPTHKTKRSAGADICAAESRLIFPGQLAVIRTGAWVPDDLPDDVFLLLAIRSSLARRGLMLANGAGIIDADYEDEIGVMLLNVGDNSITIEKGERIAQLIPMRYVPGVFAVEQRERIGGFGSTN